MKSGKQENKQIYNWALKLCEFDFVIEYRAGKLNVVADDLSRCHSESKEQESKTFLKEGGDVGVQNSPPTF